MRVITDYPVVVFVLSFAILWLATRAGLAMAGRRRALSEGEHEDFAIVQGATLTLLGLIIGFSFSMAISRYDQRKNYEEEEANAIGTEYVRADLLPADDAERVRVLLAKYLAQRILFYAVRDGQRLQQVDDDTARLQAELWAAVRTPAAVHPTPVVALVVAGMNDVLNTQGYTQASWRNRIPPAAWIMMAAIAACGSLMIGYGAHGTRLGAALNPMLPLVIAISMMLIADIDSPRGGLIHVSAQNLESLARSLHGQ